jgi:hypothetical protein
MASRIFAAPGDGMTRKGVAMLGVVAVFDADEMPDVAAGRGVVASRALAMSARGRRGTVDAS